MFINSYGSCLRIDWKVLHFCRKSLTQALVLYINILMVTMWCVSMRHANWNEPDKLAEIVYEAVSRTKRRFLVQSNSCICMEMQQSKFMMKFMPRKHLFMMRFIPENIPLWICFSVCLAGTEIWLCNEPVFSMVLFHTHLTQFPPISRLHACLHVTWTYWKC